MATSHASKDSASLADFFSVLRLRKALIALILALVVITTLAVTAFLPKWYRATTKIRVEKPEGAVQLYSAQGGGAALADGRKHAALLPVQRIPGFQGVAVEADDVGDVEAGAGEAHRISPASPPADFGWRQSGWAPPGCRSAWT